MPNQVQIIIVQASPDSEVKTDFAKELAAIRQTGLGLPPKSLTESELRKLDVDLAASGASNPELEVVLHFTGHGRADGSLILVTKSTDFPGATEGSPATIKEIVDVVSRHASVRGVVLSACHSAELAKALGAVVEFAVGFEGKIGEPAANAFVESFYYALRVGRSVVEAFGHARVSLEMNHPTEAETPRLYPRAGLLTGTFIPHPVPDASPELSFTTSDGEPVTAWSWGARKLLVQNTTPFREPLDLVIATKRGVTRRRVLWRDFPYPVDTKVGLVTSRLEVSLEKRARLATEEAEPRGKKISIAIVPAKSFIAATLFLLASFVMTLLLVQSSLGYFTAVLTAGGTPVGLILFAMLKPTIDKTVDGVDKARLRRIPLRPWQPFVAGLALIVLPTTYVGCSGEAVTNHTGGPLGVGDEAFVPNETRIVPRTLTGGFDARTCFAQAADSGDECVAPSEVPDGGDGILARITMRPERHAFCVRRWSVEGYAEDGKPRWLTTREGTTCELDFDAEAPLAYEKLVPDSGVTARVFVTPEQARPGFFAADTVRAIANEWRAVPVEDLSAHLLLRWTVAAGGIRRVEIDSDGGVTAIPLPRSARELEVVGHGSLLLKMAADPTTSRLWEVASPPWLASVEVDNVYVWRAEGPGVALLLEEALMHKRHGTIAVAKDPGTAGWTINAALLPRDVTVKMGDDVSSTKCELLDGGPEREMRFGPWAALPDSCRVRDTKTIGDGTFSSTTDAGSGRDGWFCWPDRFDCAPARVASVEEVCCRKSGRRLSRCPSQRAGCAPPSDRTGSYAGCALVCPGL